MELRLLCLLCLFSGVLAGCQSTPRLMLTPGQDEELRSLAVYVTQEALVLRRDNMRVNRATVDRLLAQHDSAVRSMFDDEQWYLYDTRYRDRLASKIWQTELRTPSSRRMLQGTPNPVSMPIGTSQQQ